MGELYSLVTMELKHCIQALPVADGKIIKDPQLTYYVYLHMQSITLLLQVAAIMCMVYTIEYHIGGVNSHANYRNMPCALCQVVGASSMIMIPSRYQCPSGWRKEYNGYIMAGGYSQAGSSMYNCIDKGLEQIPGSGSNVNSHCLYTVYTQCGYYMPCSSAELSCVVCTYYITVHNVSYNIILCIYML